MPSMEVGDDAKWKWFKGIKSLSSLSVRLAKIKTHNNLYRTYHLKSRYTTIYILFDNCN